MSAQWLGNLQNLFNALGLTTLARMLPSNVTITGGAIDGVTIGANTPAAASFTSVTHNTPSAGDSSTKSATTAFVGAAIAANPGPRGATGATGAQGPAGPTGAAGATSRNLLRNGNFAVNQRGVSGTVTLDDDQYGHDGWKGGANGATYTFSTSGADTVISISAGSLVQVIEAGAVGGTTFTASQAGGGQLHLFQPSTSAQAFGIGSATLSGATAGATLSIEVGTGTVSLVQVEAGTVASAFERRLLSEELAFCQRYYVSYVFAGAGAVQFNAYYAGGSYLGFYFSLPVPMRAQPTVGFIGTWTSFNVSNLGIAPVGSQMIEPYIQVTNTGAAGISNPANGGFFASAEL